MSLEINQASGTREEDVHAFLTAYSPEVRALALGARALILEVMPGVLELVDPPGRLLGYCRTATYRDTICVVMPLKGGVNLGFARGTGLPDAAGLLTGNGKRARHVRLTTAAELERPALRALLEAAAAAAWER